VSRRGALAVALVSAALVVACVSGPHRALLRVRGSELVDASNHRVVSRGATLYAVPFYDDGGRPDPDLARVTSLVYTRRVEVLRAMADAGVNTVRVPVSLALWNADAYGIGGRAGYGARIQTLVGAARHQGLVVIVAWFDAGTWGSQLEARHADTFEMMRAVRALLGDDPGVIYEPFNEPNNVDWPTWERVVSDELRFWRRELGYRGVLVIDTIGYSWEFDPGPAMTALASDAELLGTPQVLFANHRYANDNSCFCGDEATTWDAQVARNVGRFPILGDEYGNYNAPYPPSPGWTAGFLRHLGADVVPAGLNGALAFVWNWVDPNSITQPDAVTLTPYGQEVQRNLWRPA